MNGIGQANGIENRFENQDKESLALFGLSGIIDGSARYLDKTIGGRWWSVDPLAEISRRFSPYAYANCNPLIFTDPDGMKTVYANGGYYDDQTNESRSWYDVQNELGISDSGGGSGDEKKNDKSPTNSGTSFSGFGYSPTQGTPSQNNKKTDGTAVAQSTLLLISADLAIPEPTDAALPKWVAYAVAGTAAGAYLYSSDLLETIKNTFDPKGFKYVTYTKTNSAGLVYVGRSSRYESPEQIVRNRDSGHHIKGYGPAVLSTFAPATIDGGYGKRLLDPAYWSIRGSEQLQIEAYRKMNISGNDRNGIGPNNEDLKKFLDYGRNLLK